MSTIDNIETYSDGIVFNDKGDLRLNGSSWAFTGTARTNPNIIGFAGFNFYGNTTTNPPTGINHPYAFGGVVGGGGFDLTVDSWVDFGDQPGDELFFSPPKYEVKIVTSLLDGSGVIPSALAYLTAGSLPWVNQPSYIPMTSGFSVGISVPYNAVIPTQLELGRGDRYVITIRQIGMISNSTTITVDLRVSGADFATIIP